jgi:hypothetical protein
MQQALRQCEIRSVARTLRAAAQLPIHGAQGKLASIVGFIAASSRRGALPRTGSVTLSGSIDQSLP